MKIGVMGAGYVGITTGICLATNRRNLVLFDIDSEKIAKINQKKLPFFEKGLQELLEKTIDQKFLTATDNLNNFVRDTDGCFVCVGTPTKNNSIDTTQVENAITELCDTIKNQKKENYVIIIRSTIIPTTTKEILLPIIENRLNELKFHVCVVPEFLREGNALEDFMNPDKIVIGSNNEYGSMFVEKIFEEFKDQCEFIHTNIESSELIKYTNNSFFSMLISFSNEIANISEKLPNVDPYKILKALVSDKRITTKVKGEKIIPNLESYLVPGCGFGGSCFPKDVKAILNFAKSQKVNAPLLDAILQINDERPKKMIELCESVLGTLKNKKIAILGLTFKPETDDLRSSPSIEAINLLLDLDANISAYDPVLTTKSIPETLPKKCRYHGTLEETIKGVDAILVFTKWNEFNILNSEMLSKFMKKPLIIDGRGYLDKTRFQEKTLYKIGFSER